MVLVDTSVWIRFLANRKPYAGELDRLLDRDEAAGHDLIYGELLIGYPARREPLLSSYQLMHRLPPVPHADVAAFVRAHELHGRGIGLIDAHLLASALVANVPLWTADERLAGLASELGIGYLPGAAKSRPT
jgi:predicted nucleic acid-binding protein